MRERPILFNTEMVQAILDGRKTCTRRVVKGYIPKDAEFGYTAFTPKGAISCRGIFETNYPGYGEKFFELPYHRGDILYVRETWCSAYDGEKFFYLADKLTNREERLLLNYDDVKWHPSIHMPKEAARIWLKVTEVRMERLGSYNVSESVIDNDGTGVGYKYVWDFTTQQANGTIKSICLTPTESAKIGFGKNNAITDNAKISFWSKKLNSKYDCGASYKGYDANNDQKDITCPLCL